MIENALPSIDYSLPNQIDLYRIFYSYIELTVIAYREGHRDDTKENLKNRLSHNYLSYMIRNYYRLDPSGSLDYGYDNLRWKRKRAHIRDRQVDYEHVSRCSH